jgi:epoxyqueuosine reductase QueG
MDRNDIESLTRPLGITAVGSGSIADLLPHFPLLSPALTRGMSTGIAMAVRVSERILGEISDRPTRLYFHHYRRLNHILDMAAHVVALKCMEAGYDAVPIPASQTIDWENQRGHISHKAVAVRAGLGWIGRNNLLVTPQWGSQVRLVTVLTNAEIEPQPPESTDCGTCRACISQCPAGAIGESPGDFRRMVCFEKVKEVAKLAGIGHFICGICVRACRGTHPV